MCRRNLSCVGINGKYFINDSIGEYSVLIDYDYIYCPAKLNQITEYSNIVLNCLNLYLQNETFSR